MTTFSSSYTQIFLSVVCQDMPNLLDYLAQGLRPKLNKQAASSGSFIASPKQLQNYFAEDPGIISEIFTALTSLYGAISTTDKKLETLEQQNISLKAALQELMQQNPQITEITDDYTPPASSSISDELKTLLIQVQDSILEAKDKNNELRAYIPKLDTAIGELVSDWREHTRNYADKVVSEIKAAGIELNELEETNISNGMYALADIKENLSKAGITIPEAASSLSIRTIDTVVAVNARTLNNAATTNKQVNAILTKLPSLETETQANQKLHAQHTEKHIEPLIKSVDTLVSQAKNIKTVSEDTVEHTLQKFQEHQQEIARQNQTVVPFATLDDVVNSVVDPSTNAPD